MGWPVGLSVMHLFDDPHIAPYWPNWPCYSEVFLQRILIIRIIQILNTCNKLSSRELSLIIFANNIRKALVRIYHLLACIETRNRPELHPGLAP